MNILLYGSRGMLGEAIVEAANAAGHEGIRGAGARPPDRFAQDMPHDDSLIRRDIHRFAPHVIINAAGVIPERKITDAGLVYMNAVMPHVMAERAREEGVPMLHVSTDCVHEFTLYGRAKAAGEPAGALVVRTSFVGPDHGLWKWLVDADATEEPQVGGWRNVHWSGSTVWAVAEALVRIADNLAAGERLDGTSDFGQTINLATVEPISKYELLQLLRGFLGAPIRVRPVNGPLGINRVMTPDIRLPAFVDALQKRDA